MNQYCLRNEKELIIIDKLKIGKELQNKRERACKLYRATYDGDKCYAIVHVLSGFIMLFEDSRVYKALVQKLRNGWYLYCSPRRNGVRSFALVKNKKKPIEMTRFIAAKYNGVPQTAYDGFVVKPFEDARRTENFLDFRRYNVNLPGFDLSNRDDILYKVKPVNGEQFIHITFKNAKEPVPHIVPYEPELDEMLRTPKHCNFMPGNNERGAMSVHGGDARCNIGAFVAIYKYSFGDYRGTVNAVENYIRDFARIKKSLPDGTQADHLNCNPYISTFENLIHVDKGLNRAKWNYINWFVGDYGVHPVLNEAGEILFAYKYLDLVTHTPVTKYYKCKEFTDLVDWINLHQGRDPLTEKLQVANNVMNMDASNNILTPAGMIVAGKVNANIAKYNLESLKEHLKWRDELLALPDEAFTVHEARKVRDAEYTVRIICEMFGDGVMVNGES